MGKVILWHFIRCICDPPSIWGWRHMLANKSQMRFRQRHTRLFFIWIPNRREKLSAYHSLDHTVYYSSADFWIFFDRNCLHFRLLTFQLSAGYEQYLTEHFNEEMNHNLNCSLLWKAGTKLTMKVSHHGWTHLSAQPRNSRRYFGVWTFRILLTNLHLSYYTVRFSLAPDAVRSQVEVSVSRDFTGKAFSSFWIFDTESI